MLGAPNNALLITFVIGKKGENSIDIIGVYAYNKDMYSVQEAAELMRISRSHLRLLLKRGEVKGKRLGRDWVVLELNYQRKRKPKEKRK